MIMIDGVEILTLTTHTDERGFFREIIRADDDFFDRFGQWSHSFMVQGTIKAWHIHSIQTDWWYVPIGLVRAVLYDTRTDSKTYGTTEEYLLGDYQSAIVLKIPPLVAHGLKVLQGPAHLFYITSHIYNPSDEGRIPYDDFTIGYDWLAPGEIT